MFKFSVSFFSGRIQIFSVLSLQCHKMPSTWFSYLSCCNCPVLVYHLSSLNNHLLLTIPGSVLSLCNFDSNRISQCRFWSRTNHSNFYSKVKTFLGNHINVMNICWFHLAEHLEFYFKTDIPYSWFHLFSFTVDS